MKRDTKMPVNADFIETCDTPSYFDLLEEGRKRQSGCSKMLRDDSQYCSAIFEIKVLLRWEGLDST